MDNMFCENCGKHIIENTYPCLIGESSETNELKQKIAKLRTELSIILEKNEHLKIDLLNLRIKYNMKIGKLYLRLDELDLIILMYKSLSSILTKREDFR